MWPSQHHPNHPLSLTIPFVLALVDGCLAYGLATLLILFCRYVQFLPLSRPLIRFYTSLLSIIVVMHIQISH